MSLQRFFEPGSKAMYMVIRKEGSILIAMFNALHQAHVFIQNNIHKHTIEMLHMKPYSWSSEKEFDKQSIYNTLQALIELSKNTTDIVIGRIEIIFLYLMTQPGFCATDEGFRKELIRKHEEVKRDMLKNSMTSHIILDEFPAFLKVLRSRPDYVPKHGYNLRPRAAV